MIPNNYTLECTNCGIRVSWITNYPEEVYNFKCSICGEEQQIICEDYYNE